MEEYNEVIEQVDTDDLQVTVATKVRTVMFFIAWVNQVFAFFGAPTLDIDFDGLYVTVSAIATFAVSIWSWWKNNSFTIPALIGDQAMRAARHAKEG